MKRTWPDFLPSTRDFLAKRLLFVAAACSALTLGTANRMWAQTTYPVYGTAGFETGLQKLATVDSLTVPTIDWGDGNTTNCPPIGKVSDGCGLDFGGPIGMDVYGTHRYTSPNTYKITITYGIFGNTVTTRATISSPGNFVILSIGDSIASGEGNPVIPANPANQPNWGLWDDPYSSYENSPFPADELAEWPQLSTPCHRSRLTGAAQAAASLTAANPNLGVTFVNYACSGATISAGDTPTPGAQDAVGQLRVARGRLPRIDVLLISAGANSLYGPNSFGEGFAGLVTYCLNVFNQCANNPGLTDDLNASFHGLLPSEYTKLVKEINCINPADGTPEPSCTDPQNQIPKLVLMTEVMDPTHVAPGQFPVAADCPAGFDLVGQDEWKYFYFNVVVPLNTLIDEFNNYNYAVAARSYPVAVADAFTSHGICTGANRWVNNIGDSVSLLGLTEPHKAVQRGTAHPNSGPSAAALGLLGPNCSRCGHEDYAVNIQNSIVYTFPTVTTASATAGGAAYTFGTWATKDVSLTLSAANALPDSGVGASYYAVDNANCSPESTVSVACGSYSGPFTISSSGKHTVTFFSANAHGFFEAAQTVQVWVDNEPPVMTCKATPSVLWPPNNKMVPVALNVTAVSAAFGPTPFSLKSVTTSAGNAATDVAGFVIGQPSVTGFLRASRPGNAKAGESYTFVYQSVDPVGLTGTCTATVTVPHDQRESNP